MKVSKLLAALAAAGTLSLAACADAGPSNGDGAGGDNPPTDHPTDSEEAPAESE